jgi:hypothetical protein
MSVTLGPEWTPCQRAAVAGGAVVAGGAAVGNLTVAVVVVELSLVEM